MFSRAGAALYRSASKPRQPGFGERFISEDKSFRSHLTPHASPVPAVLGDIRTILARRVDGISM